MHVKLSVGARTAVRTPPWTAVRATSPVEAADVTTNPAHAWPRDSGLTVAVIGPGALGTLFAARLALAGTTTFILDYRPVRARDLGARGLRVLTATGARRVAVPVTADPAALARVDAVLILVKAYQTDAVATTLATYLPPQAFAVTLQNGLGNVETLQLHLGNDRVFGGTTAQGAVLEAPGVVRDTGSGPTVIGRPDGQVDSRLDDVAQALLLAGFAVSLTRDLQASLWLKAILNAAINPVAALTRLRNGELGAHASSLALMAAAAREAAHIARKHGIRIGKTDWSARLLGITQATAPNVNSMLQDVRCARRTEIDAINGAIVRTAELHNVTAPVNRSLWYLIRTIEQNYPRQLPAATDTPECLPPA